MTNLAQINLFEQEKEVKETLDSKIPKIINDDESIGQHWQEYGLAIGKAALIYYDLDPRETLTNIVNAGCDVGYTIKEINRLPYRKASTVLERSRKEIGCDLKTYNRAVLTYVRGENMRLGLTKYRSHTQRR